MLGQAKSLATIHFYDPKNMLLTDLPILLQTVGEIAQAIAAIAG